MKGKRIKVTVSVRYPGVLTPELLQQLGGKLGNPVVRQLAGRVRRGTTGEFRLGLGDDVVVVYPAQSGLRVEL